MKLVEKLLKALDKFSFVMAAICVSGMLFCVILQVVARSTKLTIAWTTELSQYFFLWSTCFASYIAARRGRLLGIEGFQRRMPNGLQSVMKFLSAGTGALFYSLVIYYCVIQLPRIMPQTTPTLKWSMGMIYIIMMVGLSFLVLYFVYTAIMALLPSNKHTIPEEFKTAEQRAEEVE
jgi:TRAP-type C4-dicarboxylate transport system permease small subunit